MYSLVGNNHKLSHLIKTLEESCMKHFSMELQRIEQKMKQVDKVTTETIELLEEKKRNLRRQTDPNIIYSQDDPEIYKYLEYFPTSYSTEKCGDKRNNKGLRQHPDIHSKYSVCELDKALADIEREIGYVQDQHYEVLQDLEKKKETLRQRLVSIGKLDLLINVITYKIFETQHEHRLDLEELNSLREQLIARTDVTENEISIKLAEFDQKMSDIKNTHESTMNSLEGQRTELRKEAALKLEDMDSTMNSLNEQHEVMLADLENSKLYASPDVVEEMDRRIEELNKMFTKDIEYLKKLQQDGWKDYDPQERVAVMLESRGLRITHSGHFLTSSGQHLTLPEADAQGYLEGIDTPSWHAFLREYQDYGKHSETDHSSSSGTISTKSRMGSDDIHYLKTVLGKPLTLALAEITAKQPRDPIHYLGHWLFKYRYNQEVDVIKKQEILELIHERDRLEKQKLHAMLEEEARAAILNMVIRAEEEAIQNELNRIAQEVAALENDENEDQELVSEARDVLREL